MKIKLSLLFLKIAYSKKIALSVLFVIFFTLNISAQLDTLIVPDDTLVIEQDTLVIQEDTLVIEQDSLDYEHNDDSLSNLDTIIAKTTKIIIEEDTLPVYSISVGRLGSTFPCGARFGISLQAPGYHIFSAESPYNATYVPNTNEIKWPDEGSNKNSMAYQNSFNRIKQLRVGTVESSFGKRWTISAEQFKENYTNLFDFDFGGEKRLSGDYNNLFFEMLISIQQLAKENEDLKDELVDAKSRLTVIEEKLNLQPPNTIRNLESSVQISPNPSNNGILNIEYTIINKVNNANLQLFDSNGKLVHKIPIVDRGSGNIVQFFSLAAGVYFYQLVTDSNESEIEKLVIN